MHGSKFPEENQAGLVRIPSGVGGSEAKISMRELDTSPVRLE